MSKDTGPRIDGILEWRDERGELHRVGGPARVFPSGREEWFRRGRLHRSNGPAVIHANGSVKYYVDGVRHREGGPACVYVNGTEKWYREGKRATATVAQRRFIPTAVGSGSSREKRSAKSAALPSPRPVRGSAFPPARAWVKVSRGPGGRLSLTPR
ncbi:MAG TPA: hypothetical protein VN758_08500 [Solirubrobacterales bacterium]|nr:hypothetical protein [Solirubrobacterales bacterium]